MNSPKSILVTGASSGLGAGLAFSYAAPGVRLVLIGRDADRLAATSAYCRAAGADVVAGTFDVREPEPMGSWLLAQDDERPLDMVLACAGVSAGTGADGELEGLTLATMQVRTNLLGAMHTLEPLLPRLVARGGGQVAVISSTAGLRGLPFSPGYSASKAGIRSYGDALRALLTPRGVYVTVVIPGFFDTPMTDRWKGPTPFMVSLDKMVSVIRRGLDKRRSRIIYPRLLALGQQAADLMPAPIGDWFVRGFRFHIEPGH